MKRKSKQPLTKRMREIKERIYKDEYELDDEGRVVVRINITDADELLSVYNDHGRQIISHETAQFINNVTKPIPNRQDIHLKISCDSYTKDKEEEYKNAITNYYVNEFAHWDINLRTTLVIALILLGVSVFSFFVLHFLGACIHPVMYTMLEIACWVFAWEAVDQMFIQRHFLKVKQHRDLQIIYAKISFKRLVEDR